MAVRPYMVGIIGTTSILSALISYGPAHAQADGRAAQIVVDAETNEVLYENNAQAARRPASITKVMTLYLLFDALRNGSITWDDRIAFSRNAANQPPTKLFVGAGNSIPVQTAVEALVLRSANDVATAVAERLGGSEANFAVMMTNKARELGMSSTTFRNASGLPNATQRTTAEDLARLAIAIHRDFPDQYHWFSAQQMSWNGQTITGHNHLMGRLQGMDGLKTGYTNASGFNLAATTQRNGRRVVTVVLGGVNRFVRDDLVEALTESAFRELGIGATQFAANTTSYEVNFRDARDAADAAALFMDLPAQRVTTGGMTTIAMARTGRRIGFERGAPTFQVADMTRERDTPARVIMGRGTPMTPRVNNDSGATDEGEAEVVRPAPSSNPTPVPVPFRVAIAPSAVPTPFPVPVRSPVRSQVSFPSTAQYNRPNMASSQTASPTPSRAPIPTLAPTPTPLRQMAEAGTAIPARSSQVPLTSTPYALRGTLGSPTAAVPVEPPKAEQAEAVAPQVTPTQMAELATFTPQVPPTLSTNVKPALTAEIVSEIAPETLPETLPEKPEESIQVAEAAPTQTPTQTPGQSAIPADVSAPESTPESRPSDVSRPETKALTQMAELAQQDAASLASGTETPTATDQLNGSINLAEATPSTTPNAPTNEAAPPTQSAEAAPVQMAAIGPDAVALAQLRQAEASAREQARIADAQALEATRREAARVQAAAAARVLAERRASEQRAERQLAETRTKALKEKEVRELALAERQAAQERALAVREEERRQAENTRARNARGTAIVQVGAFKNKKDANDAIAQFARFFPSFAQTEVSSVSRRDGIWYRARFAGLGAMAASEACRLVSGRGGACEIVGR